MSLNSVASNRTSQTKSSPVLHASAEKIIVPGIGIASQSPDGTLEVVYQDGSRLAVDQGGHIMYTQTNGIQCHYTRNDETPEVVRTRLTQFQVVLEHLMSYKNNPVPLCTPVSNKCIQPQIKFFR